MFKESKEGQTHFYGDGCKDHPCHCVCHENKLKKEYEHSSQCCPKMNGHLEDNRPWWEINKQDVL